MKITELCAKYNMDEEDLEAINKKIKQECSKVLEEVFNELNKLELIDYACYKGGSNHLCISRKDTDFNLRNRFKELKQKLEGKKNE